MKKILFLFLCIGTLLVAKDKKYSYINKKVVNIHEKPAEMTEVVTQAIYATPLKILEKKGSWIRIETPDNYQGWILKNDSITRSSSYPNTKNVAKVCSLWAHLYLVDDTTPYPPILTLPFETKVEVISSENSLDKRWMQIRLLDNKTVWAQRNEYSINPKLLSLNETVQLSKMFLGIPYTWAGTSSLGFDCSGFVQMLYRQMGVDIPRDSRTQATYSKALSVSQEELKSGDLIFFGRNDRITHVGMFLGDNKFIHSDTSCKNYAPTYPPSVVISDLTEDYWKNLYISSKRYVY